MRLTETSLSCYVVAERILLEDDNIAEALIKHFVGCGTIIKRVLQQQLTLRDHSKRPGELVANPKEMVSCDIATSRAHEGVVGA
jgi:hypothetical protein